MKNKLGLALAIFIVLSLSACANATPAASASGLSGELNVFVWTEYMPDTVFQKFTEETGVKTNVSTYSTNEDLLAKVKASNAGIYDIVVPSDYMVKMMIAEGLLEPLDKPKITNLQNIGQGYLNPSFDPGNVYSVPYMSGVAALVIDTEKVAEDITSFSQILDPAYANSIVALDDPRAVIGAVSKSLGYSLNTVDPTELAQTDVKLALLKPNIKLLDSDSPKSAMLSGEASIGYMWNAEIAICLEESDRFKAVFPEEGCYLFLDNLCVLKGAKNSANANEFINFILRPDVSKLVSDEYPYTNPNAAAVELLPESYKDNPASNVDPAIFTKGEYVADLPASELERYDDLWTRFVK
ncbi:MAG: spermidine/putrescine ABC transporter substrate-binding protein [Clostridiales bacterium]|nr:spermidine/putrescine ABC transporter substrate-binding protein [Clostridiales bacterium]